MLHAPQGLHEFFRAYYHYKSADWKGNKPHPLKAHTAEEMAKMPTYYVMDKDKGMAANVAPFMPSAAEIAACQWLTDAEVGVYVTEYARTRLHRRAAGLSRAPRHRSEDASPSCARSPAAPSTCRPASSPARATGARIRRPACSRRCRRTVCTQWRGTHFVDGAGHWVQQEQPEKASKLLLEFLGGSR